MGERCFSLKQQLLHLLDPPPKDVFIESFCGSAPRGDDVNHGLRATAQLLLWERGIPCTMVAQQTWKAGIGAGLGMRGATKKERKAAVVEALETLLGSTFPASLPITGRAPIAFRDDASDAAAIALWGVRKGCPGLLWTAPIPITAPPLTTTSVCMKRNGDWQDGAPPAKRA